MVKRVAFIPVRAGSKSIPNKNIKMLFGKPLIYWNLAALENCDLISEVIVATDSPLIKDTALSFQFTKIKVYHRNKQNATDEASTESVILEYLEFAKKSLSATDIFILAQATSPFTTDIHFTEAINIYEKRNYDSLLTCVRSKKFIWSNKGVSKNYNYLDRPRRQNFSGELIENGAFYINTVENILKNKNRLSGNIGIYEMPEHTLIELDEKIDWIVAESIFKHLNPFSHKNIKLFLTDVDGVLTDGSMYYSENGDELKKFSTYDGMAFQLLREANISTGIITSEKTKIVEQRAQKIRADFLYQNVTGKSKLLVATEICDKLKITLKETAYIGDDINCFELLSNVGIAACPVNAIEEIKNIPNIVHLKKNGGEGVVREFLKYIL
jgi:YrbI family 3-deoxy-D-manno-octulosonate 8-phosphate phosphatase